MPEKIVHAAPVPPFVTFVASAVPMVFDNSMSYYEALCALWKWLQDDVIKVINNNASVTEGYIQLTKEMKEYMDNYFDNLDVQEEINNKLDAMVEEGTLQEIITEYIQANVAWTFDTVEDMQDAENFVVGSYAQTLGYYALNDGGGALYKVIAKETPTANGNININSDFDAQLITDKANVLKFGAYGDDTNDDSTAITNAYNYAVANDKVLYMPKKVYLVSSSLNLKGAIIECEGTIDNSSTIILGGNSNGSTTTKVEIYKINDIQVEGAKNSEFDITHAGGITLYANGSISDNTSIAYNIFNGVECTSLTLNGVNNGWINENEFNIKRCNGNLTITGDGSYRHNNNHFNNICIEGAEKKIKIDYGYDNFITYRAESNPTLEISSDKLLCFGNVIQGQYATHPYGLIYNADNTSLNFIGYEQTPTMKVQRIFELDKSNVKNLNATMYLNNSGEIFGNNWTFFFDSDKIDASLPFIIKATSDVVAIRPDIICYDASDNKVEGNVQGSGLSVSSYEYITTTNVKTTVISFVPDATVKKIQVKFRIGSGVSGLHNIAIDLYQPIANNLVMRNSIATDRKYLTSSPSNISGAVWSTGDIVWNGNGGNNIAGWYCTDGGTNTWAKIEYTA